MKERETDVTVDPTEMVDKWWAVMPSVFLLGCLWDFYHTKSWNYGWYMLTRMSVSIFCTTVVTECYLIYTSLKEKNVVRFLVPVALLLLYQPVIRISFDRDVWVYINWVTLSWIWLYVLRRHFVKVLVLYFSLLLSVLLYNANNKFAVWSQHSYGTNMVILGPEQDTADLEWRKKLQDDADSYLSGEAFTKNPAISDLTTDQQAVVTNDAVIQSLTDLDPQAITVDGSQRDFLRHQVASTYFDGVGGESEQAFHAEAKRRWDKNKAVEAIVDESRRFAVVYSMCCMLGAKLDMKLTPDHQIETENGDMIFSRDVVVYLVKQYKQMIVDGWMLDAIYLADKTRKGILTDKGLHSIDDSHLDDFLSVLYATKLYPLVISKTELNRVSGFGRLLDYVAPDKKLVKWAARAKEGLSLPRHELTLEIPFVPLPRSLSPKNFLYGDKNTFIKSP